MIDILKGMWNSQWMQDRSNAGLLANILGLILILTLVGYGSAATVEFFPSSNGTYHIPFTRPSISYASNAEMLADFQSEITGNWSNMTDFEKCWEMTKYIRRHGVNCASDRLGDWDATISDATMYSVLTDMNDNEYGYYCLGHAALLMHFAHLYGFEAYAISAGNVSISWTHATTLIRCDVDGHYKMLHFDPYFGDTYIYQNGTPMSFFVMQDYIDASNFTALYRRSIGYKYDLFQVTNRSYDPYEFFEPGMPCDMQKTFWEEDVADDTYVFRYNNWFLTPYCIATESTWNTTYTNPYELWGTGEVYDAYNTAHTDVGIAYVEGRET